MRRQAAWPGDPRRWAGGARVRGRAGPRPRAAWRSGEQQAVLEDAAGEDRGPAPAPRPPGHRRELSRPRRCGPGRTPPPRGCRAAGPGERHTEGVAVEAGQSYAPAAPPRWPPPPAPPQPGPRRSPSSARRTAPPRRRTAAPCCDVRGDAMPPRASSATCSQRSDITAGSGSARPRGPSHEQAIRHGSSTARSRRACARAQTPARSNEARSPTSSSPPQTVPSSP